jgi:hypothetical protein
LAHIPCRPNVRDEPRRPMMAPSGARCKRLLGRPFRAYTALMTGSLNTAIGKLATLPPEEQDRFAAWLPEELRDEEKWSTQFRASRDGLAKLAAEARADHLAGRTSELDPEKL